MPSMSKLNQLETKTRFKIWNDQYYILHLTSQSHDRTISVCCANDCGSSKNNWHHPLLTLSSNKCVRMSPSTTHCFLSLFISTSSSSPSSTSSSSSSSSSSSVLRSQYINWHHRQHLIPIHKQQEYYEGSKKSEDLLTQARKTLEKLKWVFEKYNRLIKYTRLVPFCKQTIFACGHS